MASVGCFSLSHYLCNCSAAEAQVALMVLGIEVYIGGIGIPTASLRMSSLSVEHEPSF